MRLIHHRCQAIAREVVDHGQSSEALSVIDCSALFEHKLSALELPALLLDLPRSWADLEPRPVEHQRGHVPDDQHDPPPEPRRVDDRRALR